MFDVDKLKEALRVPARPLGSQVRSMEGWYALPLDVIDQRTIAARLVVAGQPLSFCAFHVAAGDGSLDCWGAGLNGQDDCRMVEGWWMPTGKDET